MKKIFVFFLILLIFPLLSYTFYYLYTKEDESKIIRSAYESQLQSVLFSLNQYYWDKIRFVYESFASYSGKPYFIDSLLLSENESFHRLLERETFVDNCFLTNSNNLIDCKKRLEIVDLNHEIIQFIDTNQEELLKNQFQSKKGYIKPLTVFSKDSLFYLIYPNIPLENYLVLSVSFREFVSELIVKKIEQMSSNGFIFLLKNDNDILYSINGLINEDYFEYSEELWIYPQYKIWVKAKGITLLDLLEKARKERNAALILLNVFLIGGSIWLFSIVLKEKKLVKMKTDFVANVSHELKTPLSLIKMYAETLDMNRVLNEDKKKKYYQIIIRESERLSKLISNLLNFSKIQSGKKKYYFESLNIGFLIENFIDDYGVSLKQKGFEIVYINELHGNAFIFGEKESLIQSFLNLIDNAVKYSGSNRKIIIRLTNVNEYVHINIQDFGIGIENNEQKKIFIQFYRVENSLVHNTKGSGLGLSLVKEIIEAHNGTISVKSEINKGSTFCVSIPLLKNKPLI